MTVLHKDKLNIDLDQLVTFHKLMMDHGDDKNAQKIVDLYKKSTEQDFIVSFSGHFSAGKSSMINALLDKDILPKSPIPTSANIVKITSGEGIVRVYFKEHEPIEYSEPYDMEMIKDYCKNKDEIKKIELSTGDSLIPPHCSIIDTPGIDAADEADRIITESSLHVVDILFYVMDYNHVQSEVNLYFLKKIQEIGIPYFIIINQVDKHDESEIAFSQYEKNINQTFEQWDIKPEHIYYSSLIDSQAAHNQFDEIKEKLFRQFHNKASLLRTKGSLKQIIKDHKNYLQQVYDEKLSSLPLEDNMSQVQDNLKKIRVKMETEKEIIQEIISDFQNDLHATLKNAYLMPSTLREKAGHFLESQQKNFKIGILGAKKKTELEKERLVSEFITDLQKSLEANIQWKLRDKFNALLKEYDIRDEQISEQMQQITIEYTVEDLLKHMKSGAKLNGDYVLNYTNEISTDIKNKFKQQARLLLETIKNRVEKESQVMLEVYKKEEAKLQESLTNFKQYNELQETLHNKFTVINHPPEVTQDAKELMRDKLQGTKHEPIRMESQQVENNSTRSQSHQSDNQIDKLPKSTYSITEVDPIIDRSIQAVEKLPGFQSLIHDLKEKQSRLNNRTLTIALFGAFSAGKSSFANALMGESVLPVSPNPTTAVINRINPVTDTKPHGTVVIQLKDQEAIIKDIHSITRHLSPPDGGLDRLIEWIEINNLYNSNELSHMFQSYLLALYEGYEQHKDLLGKEITISMEEFSNYVTSEHKACYMETIDLYYDCSLTQQGITLVDTPGADSINARHTNVAFDYIKYADAIFYVSYYNHALSRADKDFLVQLGRVKETFQLDKMFFIINAADLAESNSDLILVRNYVEEQLEQLGIRFPKIYPVSSKLSLEEKRSTQILNDLMASFEDDLYYFINHGLASLTVEAAFYDIHRMKKTLLHFIDTTNLNEQERIHYRNKLDEKQGQLIAIVNQSNTNFYEKRIVEKITKQLHYVVERLSIRFHDMFKEMFNPTTVTESGKKATRQLEKNLKELLDYIGYELLQEIRAVSLRVEAYMSELQIEFYEKLDSQMDKIDPNFLLANPDTFDFQTPSYEQGLTSLDLNDFSKAISGFKGTKAFFEKNEKELMKEEIYRVLLPEVHAYLNQSNRMMEVSYTNQWLELLELMKNRVTTDITKYIKDHQLLMTDTVSVEVLREKYQILNTIVSEVKKEEVNYESSSTIS
ncbi:dynamin family protein [Ornithinibacillus salinisoli]|uniref:Dynamin family protein n=1 Tax=Ornithinibacillus salinisoli TaxID=1848459 RepID=A0ABW4W2U5_9BACI